MQQDISRAIKEKPDLFSHDKSKYTVKLDLDFIQLKKLFEEDEERLRRLEADTKEELISLSIQLESLVARFAKTLAIESTIQVQAPVQRTWSVKKTDTIGRSRVNGALPFQWPSNEEIANLPRDVSVKKIKWWWENFEDLQICFLQVWLNDGRLSPYCEQWGRRAGEYHYSAHGRGRGKRQD